MRDRRVRRSAAGAGGRDRRPPAAGVPRLRLRRDRPGRATAAIAGREEGRQARQPREGDRRRAAAGRRRPASATPAGPPTARPTTSTRTRTSGSGGRVALVHNGIIENFAELRARIEADSDELGLVSETDTEVAAQLLELQLASDVDLTEAMQRVCVQLDGAFTLVAVDALDPTRVVAARRNSPLVVGLGDGENFLGSDVAAFIEHTREALELGQDQVVTITRDVGRDHRLPRPPAGGPALPRRLGPVGRREGGPRLVHAQGDLRAAARRRGLAARAAYGRRTPAPGRDAALGPGAPRHRQDHHHRVRDVVLRRAWSRSTRSSTGAGSRSRSSWPPSSATATRSSTTRRSSWRSRSRARPPTPCRRSGTRGPSGPRCSRSATPTARRSRASPTRSSTPTPAPRSASRRPRAS